MNDVSVVLCTYNGATYIEEQLTSILGQTRPPAEIIVRDDGSTDATPDIVARVATRAAIPVRFAVNERRLGFADNFLAACAAATGSVIALSDQDDRWKPQKLERSVAALERRRASLCVHAVGLMDAAGAVTAERATELPAETLLEWPDPVGNFYGFTMTFRRALLEKIPAAARGLDPHSPGAPLSHDRWIYFLATTFGRTVVLGEALAYYRQHGGQLYGGAQSRGIGERITTKIAGGEAQAAYLAEFAGHLADLLSTPPAEEGGRAPGQTGAARWRRLEAHYADRARFYGRRSSLGRAGALLTNLRHGVYAGPAAAGLGRRRLLEDVTVLVAAGLGRVRVSPAAPPEPFTTRRTQT